MATHASEGAESQKALRRMGENCAKSAAASWWYADHEQASSASSSSKPELVVHFVRHGQGTHNVAALEASKKGITCDCAQKHLEEKNRKCPYMDPELLDPRLTELGKKQAVELALLASKLPLRAVVVSPLRRTLETALLAFSHNNHKDVPFVAIEEAREAIGKHVCDKRQHVDETSKQYPRVDFSGLKNKEDVLWTPTHEAYDAMALRANALVRLLQAFAKDKKASGSGSTVHVACVSHSCFLFAIFNCALRCTHVDQGKKDDRDLSSWFQTGELRSVALRFLDDFIQ